MVFFFFQKKKQKALFRFAEGHNQPIIREADPGGLGAWPPRKNQLIEYLVFNWSNKYYSSFLEKEAKSVVPLRGMLTQNSAKPTQGGLSSQKRSCYSSFSRKRSKKRCSASQKILSNSLRR
jgi:hypothetical protein